MGDVESRIVTRWVAQLMFLSCRSTQLIHQAAAGRSMAYKKKRSKQKQNSEKRYGESVVACANQTCMRGASGRNGVQMKAKRYRRVQAHIPCNLAHILTMCRFVRLQVCQGSQTLTTLNFSCMCITSVMPVTGVDALACR